MSLAEAEFFRIRWSQKILDETQIALQRNFSKRGVLDANARAVRAIDAMNKAFPEALYSLEAPSHFGPVGLPDANDEHVVAAAIQCQAQAIVTENLKDFPLVVLEKYNLEARSADEFIADTIALDEGKAIAVVRELRERLKIPSMEPEIYIKSLESRGLLETASLLTDHIHSI